MEREHISLEMATVTPGTNTMPKLRSDSETGQDLWLRLGGYLLQALIQSLWEQDMLPDDYVRNITYTLL